MVATHDTVFTVLGNAARQRGARGLALQLVVSAIVSATVLIAAPHWWSLAFLAGWSAAYAAWGLVVRVAESREERQRSLRALLTAIAALGTALAVAGIIGVGLAIYSGDAAGAKNGRCVKDATSRRCQAQQPPVQTIKFP